MQQRGSLIYPDTLQLGGRTVRLARDVDPRSGMRTGPRLWKVETDAAPGEQDWDHFRAAVQVGHYGMGGSVRTGYRQLHHYSLDCDVEEWGFLAPGLHHTDMGLGLAAPVIDMEPMRDANGNHYLYVATQNNVLTKVAVSTGGPAPLTPLLTLDTPATVVETKVFTHGDAGAGSAMISDIIELKDGRLPYASFGDRPFAVPQPPRCLMLVGFAQTAGLAQLDTVGIAPALDVWQPAVATPAERAYAGVFAKALGENNLLSLVWKSTGAVGQAGGAFSRIQSAAVPFGVGPDSVLTTVTYWNPANTGAPGGDALAGYRVLDAGTSITSMANYQRGLVAGKPEAVAAFDQTYNSYALFGTETHRHDDNARNLLAWGHQLLIPNAQDLMVLPPRADAVAGITTLPSVADNPVRGHVTATTSYGKYGFVSVFDGLHSYLIRLRRRLAEPVPQEFLHFPMHQIAAARCLSARVFDDGAGTTYLAAGVKTGSTYDVRWWVLDPWMRRRYQTGGVWYSECAGSYDAATIIERVTVAGKGFVPGDSWSLDLIWDDEVVTHLGEVTANGPASFVLTPGVGDRGFCYQFRATCTLASPTSRPRLAAGDDGALIAVEGMKQPEQVDRIQFTIECGENVEGDDHSLILENGWQTWWFLKELETQLAPVVAEAYFGDVTPRMIAVQKVGYREGQQGDGDVPLVYADVTCRILAGTLPGGGS